MYRSKGSTFTAASRLARALGAAVLLALGAQSAFAVTLSFDSQAPVTGVAGLVENGFAVSAVGDRHYVSSGGAFCTPTCADNGSNHLLGFDAAFDIAAISGVPFSIFQIDIAESHRDMSSYWARFVRVTGIFADSGTVSVDLELDFVNDGSGPLDDFQTERLPETFSNLVGVRIEGIGGSSRSGFSLDNIVVSTKSSDVGPVGVATRAVPEPSTVALVALALAALGVRGRSRRRGEHARRPSGSMQSGGGVGAP